MKKQALIFHSWKQRAHAPRMNSRSSGRHFITAAYKSDGGEGGEDDPEKERKELLGAIEKRVSDTLEKRGIQTKDEMTAAIAEAMKPFQDIDLDGLRSLKANGGAVEVMRAMGERVAALEKRGNEKPEDMNIRGQVQAWATRNKEALDSLKAGKKVDLEPLHIRAVQSPMTVAASAANPVPYYLANGAEVVDLVRNKPTFWNRLRKGRTSLSSFPWVNKTNKQGNAEFIGEGVLKPLASFELTPETSNAKKAAEAMKVSQELLYDVDGITSLIENELRYEVDMACNQAVLTGVASSTSPAGITTISVPYSITGVETTNPNNYDAVRAVRAQLTTMNYDGDIVGFTNPIDAANMDLAKANDSGVYILPPFTTADGRTVAGATLIEDNNIAQGYLLMADMTKYKILIYQDFFISWGWENDDFRKNLITALGEIRFHQYRSANHAGSSVYDTFANIKTAIEAPVV